MALHGKGNRKVSELILMARDGAVATVTLNRPERMNALNLPMWEALAGVFDSLAAARDIRAVVLKGAGPHFAPGADISEFESIRASAEQAKAYDKTMRRALHAVRDCPKPVVAFCHGNCIGGGLELAAMADVRIANESAKFGVPIGRISVVMAHPEIAAILRLCGPARMKEILLEARVVGARDALAWGLVNHVAPDDQAEALAYQTARNMAANAPLVNAWHKKFVNQLMAGQTPGEADLEEAYRFLGTEDYAEGQAAFKEKRKPLFTGE